MIPKSPLLIEVRLLHIIELCGIPGLIFTAKGADSFEIDCDF